MSLWEWYLWGCIAGLVCSVFGFGLLGILKGSHLPKNLEMLGLEMNWQTLRPKIAPVPSSFVARCAKIGASQIFACMLSWPAVYFYGMQLAEALWKFRTHREHFRALLDQDLEAHITLQLLARMERSESLEMMIPQFQEFKKSSKPTLLEAFADEQVG